MKSIARTSDDVLFIQSEGKHDMIYESIDRYGGHIINPYRGNILPLRLLREVWFRKKLPFVEMWYNKEAVCNTGTIIIHEPLITSEYMKWLRENNSNSRIIFLYTNIVSNNKQVNPDSIKSTKSEVWSSDEFDCANYGMKYVHGYYFNQLKVKKKEKLYDVFYVGRDKGRADSLFALRDQLKELGLRPYFHIVAPRSYLRFKKSYYQKSLIYDEVREYLASSKSILCLTNGAQKGLTVRVYESLFNEIKLITDDITISNFEFYRSSNIFVLGKDNISELPQFINQPYEKIDQEILDKYTFESWMKEYIEFQQS